LRQARRLLRRRLRVRRAHPPQASAQSKILPSSSPPH
jgi:hypothetical protein